MLVGAPTFTAQDKNQIAGAMCVMFSRSLPEASSGPAGASLGGPRRLHAWPAGAAYGTYMERGAPPYVASHPRVSIEGAMPGPLLQKPLSCSVLLFCPLGRFARFFRRARRPDNPGRAFASADRNRTPAAAVVGSAPGCFAARGPGAYAPYERCLGLAGILFPTPAGSRTLPAWPASGATRGGGGLAGSGTPCRLRGTRRGNWPERYGAPRVSFRKHPIARGWIPVWRR